jgi:hypothetical protein
MPFGRCMHRPRGRTCAASDRGACAAVTYFSRNALMRSSYCAVSCA